ncbi:MAG: zf-HC2 domain-containing protein [Deltaproteobacteria bacterium]|nr:zf-HC2 domain-containing protein [Deltaproteobacteria bacterium]
MPGCKHFTPRLEMYLDGELPPVERDSVEGHLRVCPRCQKELEDLCALRELLTGAVEERVTDAQLQAVWEGVWERLRIPSLRQRVWWPVRDLFFPLRPLRTLAWGTALLVILLLTLPLVTSTPSPPVVVESVESEDPVMIFQGEEGLTIIWLFETEEGKEEIG